MTNIKNTIPTIAALRTVDGYSGRNFSVRSYSVLNDNGGGDFYWDSSSVESDNGGTIIAPTGISIGRWRRQFTGPIYVDWFGGKGNANFFNGSNGKWYADDGYVAEADDDAIKFARALTSAVQNGIKQIRIGAGNWYFKTKRGNAATSTTGNEFVRWQSGVDLTGSGTSNTFIRISPGWNTALNGGYSAAFGCVDYNANGTTCNDCEFSNFTVDHNGSFNYFYTTSGNLNSTAVSNSAVAISNGNNCRIRNCRAININSTFIFQLGTYGNVQTMTDFAITDCVLERFCNDPNLSDASYIATGGTGGIISRNICNGGAPFGYASIPFTPWSAFENHGNNFTVSHNTAIAFNGGYNVGADSADGTDIMFTGNISRGCTAGMDLFQDGARNMKRVNIINNIFEGGWYGITLIHNFTDTPGTVQDLEIAHNTFTNHAFHPGANFAIKILAASTQSASSGGISIHDNHAVGYTDSGFVLGVSNAATVLDGLQITNNWIESCGPNGIYITSPVGGTNPNIKRLFIDGNNITDTQSVLVNGIKVDGYCDSSCAIGATNRIAGYSGADILIDLSNYPASGDLHFDINLLGAAKIAWDKTAITPKIYQKDNTINSATATDLTVQAQNAIGTSTNGGNLILKSGTGTLSHGAVQLQVNNAVKLSVGSSNIATGSGVTLTLANDLIGTSAVDIRTFRNISSISGAFSFTASNSGPLILQSDLTTNGGTGNILTIQAQNATGTTSIGGSAYIRSGTGTTSDGDTYLYNGNNVRFAAVANSGTPYTQQFGVLWYGDFNTHNFRVTGGGTTKGNWNTTGLRIGDGAGATHTLEVAGTSTLTNTTADTSLYINGSSALYQQVLIDKAGIGGMSLGVAAADNSFVGFDVIYSAGLFLARNTSYAMWYKANAQMLLVGNTGAIVGNSVGAVVRANFNLANGNLRIGDNVVATHALEVAGTTQVTSFTAGVVRSDSSGVLTSYTGPSYSQLTWNGTAWVGIGIITNTLGDTSPTINIGDGYSQWVLPVSTLSTGRTVTLGVTGAVANDHASIVRLDVTANTLAIVNGGPSGGTIYTFPASKAKQGVFAFDGTNWSHVSLVQIN